MGGKRRQQQEQAQQQGGYSCKRWLSVCFEYVASLGAYTGLASLPALAASVDAALSSPDFIPAFVVGLASPSGGPGERAGRGELLHRPGPRCYPRALARAHASAVPAALPEPAPRALARPAQALAFTHGRGADREPDFGGSG